MKFCATIFIKPNKHNKQMKRTSLLFICMLAALMMTAT